VDLDELAGVGAGVVVVDLGDERRRGRRGRRHPGDTHDRERRGGGAECRPVREEAPGAGSWVHGKPFGSRGTSAKVTTAGDRLTNTV
jgi:hypothetical protein